MTLISQMIQFEAIRYVCIGLIKSVKFPYWVHSSANSIGNASLQFPKTGHVMKNKSSTFSPAQIQSDLLT